MALFFIRQSIIVPLIELGTPSRADGAMTFFTSNVQYLSVGKCLKMVRHVAVHFRRDFALAEGVVDGRVEAGSHEHELGIELKKV